MQSARGEVRDGAGGGRLHLAGERGEENLRFSGYKVNVDNVFDIK